MLKTESNKSLKSLNTFGVDVRAKHFVCIRKPDDLVKISTSKVWTSKRMFLGGGSNVLFLKDFDGLLIQNALKGISIIDEDEKHVYLKIMSGENWHQLVMHCVAKGWGGIENLALIPGTAGAAPIQNIGAYGVELKDIFHSLEALDLETFKLHTIEQKECDFGYRKSRFKTEWKERFFIQSICLKLSKKPVLKMHYGAIKDALAPLQTPGITDLCRAVIKIRKSKLPDPAYLGNAGSFFKNPIIDSNTLKQLLEIYPEIPHYPAENNKFKLAAAWLIDQIGLKGVRSGDTGTFEKQALVIVNYGHAKGSQIWQFANRIMDSVESVFGIRLQPEVSIIA